MQLNISGQKSVGLCTTVTVSYFQSDKDAVAHSSQPVSVRVRMTTSGLDNANFL